MSGQMLLIGAAVVVVLAVVVAVLAYQAGRRRDEWERHIAESFATIAANRSGQSPRHAATMPRTGAVAASPVPAPAGQRRPAAARPAGQQTQRSRPAITAPPRQRIVTTAGELGPVFYPRGDTRIPVRPQAAPHPGPDTLARGELVRMTDAWIAALERDEAAWRAQAFGCVHPMIPAMMA